MKIHWQPIITPDSTIYLTKRHVVILCYSNRGLRLSDQLLLDQG